MVWDGVEEGHCVTQRSLASIINILRPLLHIQNRIVWSEGKIVTPNQGRISKTLYIHINIIAWL